MSAGSAVWNVISLARGVCTWVGCGSAGALGGLGSFAVGMVFTGVNGGYVTLCLMRSMASGGTGGAVAVGVRFLGTLMILGVGG